MLYKIVLLQDSPGKGRGMFAGEVIKKGELIEASPVIVMDARERKHLDKTHLYHYIFEWGDETQCALGLGYISLYNHHYTSNAEYLMDYDDNLIYIKAVKNIKAGEEVTINYNGVPNDGSKVWFDAS